MIKIKKQHITNTTNPKLNGYVGRIDSTGTLSLDSLARLCSENNTVTRADALAVLEALFTECIHALQQGYTVSIGDLGFLRLTLINTEGTATEEEWTAENIKKFMVRYTPSTALRNAIAIGADRVTIRVVQ